MKRFFYLFTAAALVMGAASCDKNDENGTVEVDRPSGPATTALTPEQCKAKLEQTAKKLTAEADINNWKDDVLYVYNTVGTIGQMDFEDVDYSEAKDRIEDILRLWNFRDNGGSWSAAGAMIRLSQATGHFALKDNKLVYTAASDLQLSANVNGEDISLTFSATDGSFLLKNIEDSGASAYLPSAAHLTFLRKGNKFATLDVTLDVTDANKDGALDPEHDKLSATYDMNIGQYTLSLSKAEYSPTQLSESSKISRGGTAIVTVNTNATYTLKEDEILDTPITPKNVETSIDLVGITQIYANVPDFASLENAVVNLSTIQRSSNASIDNLKAALSTLEKTYDAGVYFDGSSTKQATVGFEATEEEGLAVVVRFADGSVYGVEQAYSLVSSALQVLVNWFQQTQEQVQGLFDVKK